MVIQIMHFPIINSQIKPEPTEPVIPRYKRCFHWIQETGILTYLYFVLFLVVGAAVFHGIERWLDQPVWDKVSKEFR